MISVDHTYLRYLDHVAPRGKIFRSGQPTRTPEPEVNWIRDSSGGEQGPQSGMRNLYKRGFGTERWQKVILYQFGKSADCVLYSGV